MTTSITAPAPTEHDEIVKFWPLPTAEQVEILRRCLPPVDPVQAGAAGPRRKAGRAA